MFGKGVKQVVKSVPGVVASGVGKMVEITRLNASEGIVADKETQQALTAAINAAIKSGVNLTSEQLRQISTEVSNRMQKTTEQNFYYMQRQLADQFKEQQNDLIRIYTNRPEVKPAFEEAVKRYSISDEERQKIADGVKKTLEENGSLKGLSSEDVEKSIGDGVQKKIEESLSQDQDFEKIIKEDLLSAMTENPDSIKDILGSELATPIHEQLKELGERQDATVREALLKKEIKADADYLKKTKESMPDVKITSSEARKVARVTEVREVREVREARQGEERERVATDVIKEKASLGENKKIGVNNGQRTGNVTNINQGRKRRRENSLVG